MSSKWKRNASLCFHGNMDTLGFRAAVSRLPYTRSFGHESVSFSGSAGTCYLGKVRSITVAIMIQYSLLTYWLSLSLCDVCPL